MSSNNSPDLDPYLPSAETSYVPNAGQKRWSTQTLLVVSLYVLLAISAASSVFYYESNAAYYSCTIAFSIIATIWAVNDSLQRNGTFHPVLRMLHLLFCPLSIVIYLVCTRGLRGLGLAVVHAVAMLVVANIAFYGLFYAIYFTGYWNLYDPVFLEQ